MKILQQIIRILELSNKIADDDNEQKILDTAYELTRDKLQRQVQANTSLELKSGVVFSLAIAFLGAIIASAGYILNELIGLGEVGLWSLVGLGFIAGGMMFLLVAISLFVSVFYPRKYQDPPAYDCYYFEDSMSGSSLDYKNRMVRDMIESLKANEKVHDDKCKWFKCGLIAVLVSFVLVLAGYVIIFVCLIIN